MKLEFETFNGRKSIDRQVEKTVKFVNRQIKLHIDGHQKHREMSDDQLVEWGKTVIERAIKNIARDCVAVRID